jgi:hypothetical protein
VLSSWTIKPIATCVYQFGCVYYVIIRLRSFLDIQFPKATIRAQKTGKNVMVCDIQQQDIHHMWEARLLLAWRTASSSSVSSHKLSSIFEPTTRNRSPHSVFMPAQVTTVSY